MINENSLLKKFLLEFSRAGSRLFRCNTGTAWTGKKCIRVKDPITVNLDRGDMIIKSARPFKTGWPKGTSDLIGFTKVTITSDMVGREMAIFTAVEAKTAKLKPTKEQSSFVRMVRANGGISAIAYDLKDIFEATSNYLLGERDERTH